MLTVVWQSVVNQYLDEGERDAIRSAFASAAGGPLAWLTLEPPARRRARTAASSCAAASGPEDNGSGVARLLAHAGYHGPPVAGRPAAGPSDGPTSRLAPGPGAGVGGQLADVRRASRPPRRRRATRSRARAAGWRGRRSRPRAAAPPRPGTSTSSGRRPPTPASGPSIARMTSASAISAAGRASRCPPSGPRRLSTSPAWRSPCRMFSRNFTGISCARASASAFTGRAGSPRAPGRPRARRRRGRRSRPSRRRRIARNHGAASARPGMPYSTISVDN